MSPRAPARPRPTNIRSSNRRGAAVILVVLGLGVLMMIAALVVDLGFAGNTQAQLQYSAESAAHAGALQLDGTYEGIGRAQDAALRFAEINGVNGRPVILSPVPTLEGSWVRVGQWDAGLRRFQATEDPKLANAVRVRTRMNDLPGWFSPVVQGTKAMAASADTIAVNSSSGASEMSCFLPLAISSCLLQDPSSAASLPLRNLVLNPAGVDNVGWARPAATPNAAWLSSQLSNCRSDGRVAIGDEIGLNNGVINSVLTQMASMVASSSTLWDTRVWGALPSRDPRSGVPAGAYGHTLEGAILVFDDPSYCVGKGGAFNKTKRVAAFMWVAIYDVTTSGPNRTIKVRADTRREHRVGWEVGGPDYGVTTPHVYLAN